MERTLGLAQTAPRCVSCRWALRAIRRDPSTRWPARARARAQRSRPSSRSSRGLRGTPSFVLEGDLERPLTLRDPERVLVEAPLARGRVAMLLLGAEGEVLWRRELDIGERPRIYRSFLDGDGFVLVRGRRAVRLRSGDGTVVYEKTL